MIKPDRYECVGDFVYFNQEASKVIKEEFAQGADAWFLTLSNR
jgi:hypothetical protein